MITTTRHVKPFLKWAGGKSQLLEQILLFLPSALKTGKIKKYFEPFLGGGAIYFWLAEHFDFEYTYLYELNPFVANSYQVIQNNVNTLIKELSSLQMEYLSVSDKKRENYFYDKREEFNSYLRNRSIINPVRVAAVLIFLNRTCFNGLYRVNSKGEFNVPFGRYKNPLICNENNLLAVHDVLQKAEIICGDFQLCLKNADHESFVYFDPPYRPISATASFSNYSKDNFNDNEQKRLRHVFGVLDRRGSSLMLSNSDPKNIDPKDDFFDDLYQEYHIERLNATRLINCDANRRGVISELLIMNYAGG